MKAILKAAHIPKMPTMTIIKPTTKLKCKLEIVITKLNN